MIIEEMKNELQQRKGEIKGVIVSEDLMKEMEQEGEIEIKEFCPVGIPSAILSFPVIKGTNTIVWVNPSATGNTYTLPIFPS